MRLNEIAASAGAHLRDLEVLVIDCQASGATPEHGDLLELAWGFVGPAGLRDVEGFWIRPKTDRPISQHVRRLLGWSEACLQTAIEAEVAWARLIALARPGMPTVIHWARFEKPFLKSLHGSEPPFDIRCLHELAERLFYGLPRTNLRALAGHLGHSPGLLRRARGHVEATAYVWRAIVPRLESEGMLRWADLDEFVSRPVRRAKKPIFPCPQEKRRLLPDEPGVYRFLRSNGDVLYVGKAASIRKRVSSHFASGKKKSDALEMLSQAAEVACTATETALEAALLEVDEIHRLDPPYNSQLRIAERRAWFASRDFDDVRDFPDAAHRIGPLPSAGAVAGLAAMTKLLAGRAPTAALRAAAVRVAEVWAPERALFEEAWSAFAPGLPLLVAGRALHPLHEGEAPPEDSDVWNRERVLRHLTRTLAGESLLVRRARFLCLLVDAEVTFREKGRERRLGEERRRPRSRDERLGAFDAKKYDRTRVLATELRRVHMEGGYVEIRVGPHCLSVERLFSGL